MTSKNPSQRIIPHLVTKGADKALSFYQRAFGAEEEFRLTEPGGKIGHAEMTIGGAMFMLSEEYPDHGFLGPEARGGTSVSITLYVEDVDRIAKQAVEAGAVLERPIENEFYGDRVARLRDPFGHRWGLQQRIEDVSTKEMQRRFDEMMKPKS